MIDLQTLLVFAVACLALTATPGPDMLLIASRSVTHGIGTGFATLAGIQCGTYIHALAAALGLSQLFLVVPVAYDVVRFAGAAYLLFLAWQALTSTDQAAGAPRETMTGSGGWTAFRQGLITNILNPKMALFVLALFPQFVQAGRGDVAIQILVLATVLNAIGLVVNGGVILVAARARDALFSRASASRLPRYLLATVFGGLALRLAFDSRR